MTEIEEVRKRAHGIMESYMAGTGKISTMKNELGSYLSQLVQDSSIMDYIITDKDPLINQDFTVEIIGTKSYILTMSRNYGVKCRKTFSS